MCGAAFDAVPERGVEPPCPCGRCHLKTVRIPFRHSGNFRFSEKSEEIRISVDILVFRFSDLLTFVFYTTTDSFAALKLALKSPEFVLS
jgi:hypothetical protein